MKLVNAMDNLCVICGVKIGDPGFYTCAKCGKVCTVHMAAAGTPIGDRDGMALVMTDTRSDCCNGDIHSNNRITCSKKCHERYVMEMEQTLGPEKTVVDMVTGKAYRVPVRDILETGVNQQDLQKYPEVKA